MTYVLYILVALLIFGVLIAVHEWGHYIAARICGVTVYEFAIGMGPMVYHKEKRGCRYSIRLLPIGGFCSLEGEEEESDDPNSLNNQGFWKKVFIFAAGALMNFILGLVIIVFILLVGSNYFATFRSDAVITGFADGFQLEGESGLMEGDILYKIDGYRVYNYTDASLFLQYNDGNGVDLVVIRNGEKITLKAFPMYRSTYEGVEGRFGITIAAQPRSQSFFGTLRDAWYMALDFVQLVWFSLAQLFNGQAGVQDLTGAVGIVSTITEVGVQSTSALVAVCQIGYFAALIAVNLAVMNLLPIPALDGGKIFFLVVNAVAMLLFRRKIPAKYENYIHAAGFLLLMGLMVVVTFQDVWRLFQ